MDIFGIRYKFNFNHLFVILLLHFTSCTKDKADVDLSASGYPDQVAKLILNRCTNPGCHNQTSKYGAAGLSLSTWEQLFEGGNNGAAVIPFRPDLSTLCYFTNTYPDFGISLLPVMPLNQTPLTRNEFILLRDWITSGAPDRKGNIKFSNDPGRKKIYVTNQLCDVVTVFDANTLLQMRYVTVGNSSSIEFPICIKVAPDKKNWFVSFLNSTGIVQKFNAANDSYVGEVFLGTGSWTSFQITVDSKYGYFVDNSSPGKIAYVDLEQMTVLSIYTFGNNFIYPRGIALNENLNTIYVGANNGNYIYKIDITDPYAPVIGELAIDGTSTIQYQSDLDPFELSVDPKGNNCYICCRKSNEIRIINMHSDSLVNIINLVSSPAFLDFSNSSANLFVSCTDDTLSFPGGRGSVIVIDYLTNAIRKSIYSGYQPVGLAVDEYKKMVVIVNSNISTNGPAPHHVSGCGGRNGNVTFIDLQALELIPGKKTEVAVYPYGISVR